MAISLKELKQNVITEANRSIRGSIKKQFEQFLQKAIKAPRMHPHPADWTPDWDIVGESFDNDSFWDALDKYSKKHGVMILEQVKEEVKKEHDEREG